MSPRSSMRSARRAALIAGSASWRFTIRLAAVQISRSEIICRPSLMLRLRWRPDDRLPAGHFEGTALPPALAPYERQQNGDDRDRKSNRR